MRAYGSSHLWYQTSWSRAGLTALRNQLTVKPSEQPVQANDERLLLAKAWLDDDPGAQELFLVWENANGVRRLFSSMPSV